MTTTFSSASSCAACGSPAFGALLCFPCFSHADTRAAAYFGKFESVPRDQITPSIFLRVEAVSGLVARFPSLPLEVSI